MRHWLWVLAGAAALLVVVRPGRGPAQREIGVGRELVGTWRTTHPGHADRYLAIAADEIVFGQGGTQQERRQLVGVFLEEGSANPPVYVLRYTIDEISERTVDLRVLLHDGVLHIENQPQIAWTR